MKFQITFTNIETNQVFKFFCASEYYANQLRDNLAATKRYYGFVLSKLG